MSEALAWSSSGVSRPAADLLTNVASVGEQRDDAQGAQPAGDEDAVTVRQGDIDETRPKRSGDTLASAEVKLDRPDMADHHGEHGRHGSQMAEAEVAGEPNSKPTFSGVQEQRRAEPADAEQSAHVAGSGIAAAVLANVTAGAPAEEVVAGGEAAYSVARDDNQDVFAEGGRHRLLLHERCTGRASTKRHSGARAGPTRQARSVLPRSGVLEGGTPLERII